MARERAVRIVVDTEARTPPGARLLNGSMLNGSIWLLHADDLDPSLRAAWRSNLEATSEPDAPGLLRREAASRDDGPRFLPVPRAEKGLDLPAAMQALGAAGLTRVMVEGGAGLAGGLLAAGLVDRLAWFHAPTVMGSGLGAARFHTQMLAAMPRFRRTAIRPLGDDVLTEYEAA